MKADLDHLDRLHAKGAKRPWSLDDAEGIVAIQAAYPSLSQELRSSRSRLDNLRAAVASAAYRLETMQDPAIASIVSALGMALVLDDKAAEEASG